MNLKYVLAGILFASQLAYGYGAFIALLMSIASSSVSALLGIAEAELGNNQIVEVHNEGKHHAHLWCASKDDKIGGDEGIWVPPGQKLAWSFGRGIRTQFWCNMDWYGQRVGWDVYVYNWGDAPNPTKWSIRNDGVYDQWRNRKWRNLNS